MITFVPILIKNYVLAIISLVISARCYLSIPPENIRKHLGFKGYR